MSKKTARLRPSSEDRGERRESKSEAKLIDMLCLDGLQLTKIS